MTICPFSETVTVLMGLDNWKLSRSAPYQGKTEYPPATAPPPLIDRKAGTWTLRRSAARPFPNAKGAERLNGADGAAHGCDHAILGRRVQVRMHR